MSSAKLLYKPPGESGNPAATAAPSAGVEVAAQAECDDDECIRIGPDFQADVPDRSALDDPDDHRRSLELIQWIPAPRLDDATLEIYVHKSKELYGYEEDQALGMLLFHDYDFDKAFADQANYVPDWEDWTCEEKVLFKEAFNFHGKDFSKYLNKLPSKSMGAIIRYYYLHKKHKRLRGGFSKRIPPLESNRCDKVTKLCFSFKDASSYLYIGGWVRRSVDRSVEINENRPYSSCVCSR